MLVNIMADRILVRMFGGFRLSVNGEPVEELIAKSKKGLALLQHLMVMYPSVAPNDQLIEQIWNEKEGTNPESALKTLVSRLRASLNQIADGLGNCIGAGRGGYCFQPAEGVWVDLLEFRELVSVLKECTELSEDIRQKFHRLQSLYIGELLKNQPQSEMIVAAGILCHDQYMDTVYRVVKLLRENNEFEKVVEHCRFALEKDPFNEQLHLELMQALVKLNRTNEATTQYKHVANLHNQYLNEQPPRSIQSFYSQIMQSNDSLEMDLDSVRRELNQFGETHGAFECSYSVFREVYNLQMRNLKRLNASMYIAMIMITGADGQPIPPFRLEEIMRGLGEVLCGYLRRGDTVSRFSSNQYCLLLPTVNDDTGHMVMERVKRHFYQRFSSSDIMFTYRISLMSDGLKH